ncbi:MAG: FAD:protein FMN transferase [Bacteroidota bacterium]|nr:FAD:protein FMN transferase [Bacteroidota bacterium]
MKFNFIVLSFVFAFVSSCSDGPKQHEKYTVIKGKTMGSTYEIAYDSSINIQEQIDYMLGFYNYLLSTYDSSSIISKFNNNLMLTQDDSISFYNSREIFTDLDRLSNEVYQTTEGSFNPGIASLINYWGFGENKKNPESMNPKTIDSLKKLVYGFKVDFLGLHPLKLNVNQKLNYNGIAAGQMVDLIAKTFDSIYHFKNYYINISGEIRAKGNNGSDSYWPIKIEKPMLNSHKQIAFATLPLKNYSLATSGNYRQFFFKEGKRYGHSIDPISGYPARNEMLSATILAPNAALADAYATACMVMGLKKSIQLIESKPELKAFLIYEKDKKIEFWSSANLSFELEKE